MVELALRQQLLWAVLKEHSPIQPMLRISRTDDCFWICDLPRRTDVATCITTKTQLEKAGFIVSLHEHTRLWHIDLSPQDSLFAEETQKPLPFPENEALHHAYALYRLLKAHQIPWNQQITPLLRTILKLTAKSPTDVQTALTTVTSQCAALLNRKQPLPTVACNALAQWIEQEDTP